MWLSIVYDFNQQQLVVLPFDINLVSTKCKLWHKQKCVSWSTSVMNHSSDKLPCIGILNKTKSVNDIDAEISLTTKTHVHVKYILSWKNKKATLCNPFENAKK